MLHSLKIISVIREVFKCTFRPERLFILFILLSERLWVNSKGYRRLERLFMTFSKIA